MGLGVKGGLPLFGRQPLFPWIGKSQGCLFPSTSEARLVVPGWSTHRLSGVRFPSCFPPTPWPPAVPRVARWCLCSVRPRWCSVQGTVRSFCFRVDLLFHSKSGLFGFLE